MPRRDSSNSATANSQLRPRGHWERHMQTIAEIKRSWAEESKFIYFRVTDVSLQEDYSQYIFVLYAK